LKKRLRKKRRDSMARFLADGLGLYSRTPPGEQYQKLSAGLLELTIGLVLAERHHYFARGSRQYWLMDPPTGSTITLTPDLEIRASGIIRYRAPDDERVLLMERYHLRARPNHRRSRFDVTLVTSATEDRPGTMHSDSAANQECAT
jgi:hypothetical protein